MHFDFMLFQIAFLRKCSRALITLIRPALHMLQYMILNITTLIEHLIASIKLAPKVLLTPGFDFSSNLDDVDHVGGNAFELVLNVASNAIFFRRVDRSVDGDTVLIILNAGFRIV
jgi:hypothetical protein